MKHSSSVVRFLAVATTTALAIGMAGCSSTPEATDDGEIKDTTIRVTLANHVWTETIKDLIPEFEEETGAKVEITQLAEDQT